MNGKLSAQTVIIAGATILGLSVLIWAAYLLFFVRTEVRAVILDRWWTAYTTATYTTAHTEIELEETCTGHGANRTCYTVPRSRTVTERHVRCRKEKTGRDLPVKYPSVESCMVSGDSVGTYVYFRVRYRVEETGEKRTADFARPMWNRLEIENRVTIITNGFHYIVEVR